jgi:hypothetical protein
MGTRGDWESVSVDDLFREASTEGKWFTSVKFEILRKSESGRIARTGIVSTLARAGYIKTSKAHPELFSVWARLLTEAGRELCLRLSERSRLRVPDLDVRPLAIEYKSPRFESPAAYVEFIAAARKLPRFAHSIIHGNPYLHISMMDYTDGSAYDLFILESTRVLLVPQVRATPSSLNRLLSGIFSHYPEGEVVDVASTGL